MRFTLLIFFQILLGVIYVQAQKNRSTNILISRDSLKGENIIRMFIDDKKVDSIAIGDMDYIEDSLFKLNDSTWKYIYSIGFDTSHGMVTVRQVLLQNIKMKIHFSFVGEHKFYFIPDKTIPYTHISNYKYELDSSMSKITMNHLQVKSIHGEHSIDSVQEIVYLNYDVEKKVYYSSIDYLNGEYRLYPREKKRREYDENEPIYIFFENEKVYRTKIGKSNYIYLKDRWYKVNKFPYHINLVSFLPI